MSRTTAKPPKVPDAFIAALEGVLAYLWEAERADFFSLGLEAPSRQDHVFRHLEVIRRWLDYAEEECGRG